MSAAANPPQHGEGDRAKRGGGGSRTLRRPSVYTARKLRREMSLPEVLVWQRLRGDAAGLKFRRQHPIGPYVADFFCAALKLVVEIDGEAHNRLDRSERDQRRDHYLNENGYRVVRIAAADILRDADQVVDALLRSLSPLHHPADGPPPHSGEDF